MTESFDVTPEELHQRRLKGEDVFILDVREPFEFEIANLGGTLIPLGELGQRHTELDPEVPIYVLCHHGVRSAHASAFLRGQGFSKVKNIRGGIDRWSLAADPAVPRY